MAGISPLFTSTTRAHNFFQDYCIQFDVGRVPISLDIRVIRQIHKERLTQLDMQKEATKLVFDDWETERYHPLTRPTSSISFLSFFHSSLAIRMSRLLNTEVNIKISYLQLGIQRN